MALKDKAQQEWPFICFHLLRYLRLLNSAITFSRSFSKENRIPESNPPLWMFLCPTVFSVALQQVTIICRVTTIRQSWTKQSVRDAELQDALRLLSKPDNCLLNVNLWATDVPKTEL